jgi:arylsulfatase A
MATLAAAAGATVPAGASPDGHSELAALLDPVKSPINRSEGILHGTASLALRQGLWIYIPKQGSGGKTAPEPAKPFGLNYKKMNFNNSDIDENGKIKSDAPKEQLYDLENDLGQHENLANKQPEKLESMRQKFAELTKGSHKQAGGGE